MSTQEQTDFKLVLKLQKQEMESRSVYEISPCSEPTTTKYSKCPGYQTLFEFTHRYKTIK